LFGLSLLAVTALWLSGCAGGRTHVTPMALHLSATPARSTVAAAASPTAGPTSVPLQTATRTPFPTETSTATPTFTPTPVLGLALVAFETDRDGQGEIYALEPGSGDLANLTRHPAEDRAPAWSPDGRMLAFESHRDGNWELYSLDLGSGQATRLTDAAAYDGAPAWSPDGRTIAFESYRDGNLEIYLLTLSDGTLRRLTQDPAGDYGPAWSPDGRFLAFSSWRDGNKEVYLVPADGGEARNLTANPADDEEPAWAPDSSALAFVSWRDVDAATGNRNAEIYFLPLASGEPRSQLAIGAAARLTDSPWPDLDPAWDAEGHLVWAAYDPGLPFETYDPYRLGDLSLYRSRGAGIPGARAAGAGPLEPQSLGVTARAAADRRPAPAPRRVTGLESLRLAAADAPGPTATTPVPALTPGALAQIVQVPSIVTSFAGEPVTVNELVAPSLVAWQRDLVAASGWDFLQQTLGTWRPLDTVRKRAMYAYDYGYLSWHKTGRALDLALEFKVKGVNQMILTREDLGRDVYWRIYLRTARQDGTQGEPLKENPWLYWWQIVPEEEPEAYAAGGKRRPVPAGYYADVTALADRHGWQRIASYAIEGDYRWQTDSNGTEYWHYERTDGLVWWDAMRQIYPLEELEPVVGWLAGLEKAQTEEMMRSKGVPTPTRTPQPSPTAQPG